MADSGIRFRKFTAGDTIGTSHVRNVVARAGTVNVLTVSGSGILPNAGDLVFFGIAGEESFAAMITGTEAAEDMRTILACLMPRPRARR